MGGRDSTERTYAPDLCATALRQWQLPEPRLKLDRPDIASSGLPNSEYHRRRYTA